MSTIAALIGPIEWWWDTPEDPQRFVSDRARTYRAWRGLVNDRLVEAGWLVYRPHEGFKGTWDERAQVFNDEVVKVADIVISLRPPGIPGKGTDRELALAARLGKPVVHLPPGTVWTVEDLLRVKPATLPTGPTPRAGEVLGTQLRAAAINDGINGGFDPDAPRGRTLRESMQAAVDRSVALPSHARPTVTKGR